MRRFQFKLKALLSYREHAEKRAKEEVAKIQFQIQRCKDTLLELTNRRDQIDAEIGDKLASGMLPQEHLLYSGYKRRVLLKMEEQKNVLEQLTVIFRVKQEELIQKSVEKKIIENLKEKQKSAYYLEMDKQEMKAADEMALIRRAFQENIDG